MSFTFAFIHVPGMNGCGISDAVLLVQDVVGKHMLKVEPLNAILDLHYFKRGLHECLMAWLRSHSLRSQDQLPRYALRIHCSRAH